MSKRRHFSKRILNPFSGIAHIVEANNTRAICTDGINWQIQIAQEIVQSPWSELKIYGHSEQYLKYGRWSKSSGLITLPLHPTLYKDHTLKLIAPLISRLTVLADKIPFATMDIYELWLFDVAFKPVVLIASSVDQQSLSFPETSRWYPFKIDDEHFMPNQDGASILAQNTLITAMQTRLGRNPACAWIKRDKHRPGQMIKSRPHKMIKNHPFINNEQFPELMLNTDWDTNTVQTLVNDYLAWQAPILLTLEHLSDKTREKLEVYAEQRPEVVKYFYRSYPKVIDTILLNKILVEARMRAALTKTSI